MRLILHDIRTSCIHLTRHTQLRLINHPWPSGESWFYNYARLHKTQFNGLQNEKLNTAAYQYLTTLVYSWKLTRESCFTKIRTYILVLNKDNGSLKLGLAQYVITTHINKSGEWITLYFAPIYQNWSWIFLRWSTPIPWQLFNHVYFQTTFLNHMLLVCCYHIYPPIRRPPNLDLL